MSDSVPERYLLLGLRLGRHVGGLVDGYFGPDTLRATVEQEEPAEPAALVEEARELRSAVEASDFDEQRRRWLSAQVQGLECVAEMVAGADVPWSDAVRRCYGIAPEITPDERFEEAHERLAAALPGEGELIDRLERWRETQHVSPEQLMPAFDALVEDLRARTRELVELPEGEQIDAETVNGQPWGAYNWYLGELKSRIEINTDLPMRAYFLAVLAAHEAYPGHHTEAVCKEARLVHELGRLEQAILLIHTPECLVAEGIATIAIEQAFGTDWPKWAAELLQPLGVPFDADVTQVVVETQEVLGDVDVNIAAYTAERGWTEDEAVAYHRRWALSTEDRARKAARFDAHPMWGIYVPTYSYGYRLARAYAESHTDGFRALLTKQLTTADLLSAAASDSIRN